MGSFFPPSISLRGNLRIRPFILISPLLNVPFFSLEAFNAPGIFLSTALPSLLSSWHHPKSLYQPYATGSLPHSYAPGLLYYTPDHLTTLQYCGVF